MDSNYLKELEEEIQKRKGENNVQINISQLDNEKEENENSEKE